MDENKLIESVSEFIDANDKKYEKIIIEKNIDYNNMMRGMKIVEKFISERGLILYGGQAIDFALRLKGDKIYEDDAVPDYDMFSSDSVNDSYDLTEILAKEGMEEARSVVGYYVRAMKNSVSANRAWIADLAYIPKEIFGQLPILEYKGMKIIHPHYQMIDIHQSLSNSFQNPSMGEPIFFRYKKEIARYNKLLEYYPFEQVDIKKIKTKPNEITLRYITEVLVLFPAYGAMVRKFKELVKESSLKFPELNGEEYLNKIFPLDFNIAKSKLTIQTYGNEFSMICCDINGYLNKVVELSSLVPKHFNAFLNIIPKKTMFNYRNYIFTIYNTEGYLINYSEFNIDGVQVHVAGIQYQLKILLAKYIFEKSEDMKRIYIACYNSLLLMMSYNEKFIKLLTEYDENKLLTDKSKNTISVATQQLIMVSPFMLPITTYGDKNKNERDEINIINLERVVGLTEDKPYPLPQAYSAKNQRPPNFDYSSSKYFSINGAEIK